MGRRKKGKGVKGEEGKGVRRRRGGWKEGKGTSGGGEGRMRRRVLLD